jgi:hypothetical protein
MTDEVIPADLRDFILKHIDSVTQLEALLLLRANPGESWDVARTAQRLYAKEAEVAEALARLCSDGLLHCVQDVYRCADVAPDLLAMVDRLAAAYARYLIPVTNIIHAKPGRIRQFADAFKFRKEP